MSIDPVFDSSAPHAGGEEELVKLDPDHPGFRDPVYRLRRNQIARLALEYHAGEPAPLVDYTNAEHAVWRTVWEHLAPLHGTNAVTEWREGAAELDLDQRFIPQLIEVNEDLKASPGIEMLPVAGLISARGFLCSLGRGVFLSTQYIRHHSMPLYTPEPDVVHELIGHATSFFRPEIVRLTRLFGEAALKADEETLRQLERVYWYTLEFGVAREDGDVKAYGAGLLSSFGELGRFASHAELKPFDLSEIARTNYDPTNYQKVLFVAPSFSEMEKHVGGWLEESLERQKSSSRA
ncbi:MAG TPA: phenylalanine 4-monooxygenase [Thermoanaerobaculia bacterium]|jgi:phenylalanine-4-hydroxylase|nr:phenylalanine 4-monooxygenase [Thermoanaerobaculia bacterium]